MNQQWEAVKEFQLKFGHPVANSPKMLDHDRAKKTL